MLVCRNWQTRQTQTLLFSGTCGFKSHHQHSEGRPRSLFFYTASVNSGFWEVGFFATLYDRHVQMLVMVSTVAQVLAIMFYVFCLRAQSTNGGTDEE